MSKDMRIDCTENASKRPEAIQYLMSIRRKIMRDGKPLLIERVRKDNGDVVTTITEYANPYKGNSEAAKVEAVKPEPATVDSVKSDSAKPEPVKADPVKSESTEKKPEPVKPPAKK